MTPRRLRLHGITRFAQPVDLDLTGLPHGLICLVGPNGAGKTTIMECMAPAALFRRLPTRDSRRGLLDVATRRDASLDVEIEYDGHVWRLLHHLDPDHSDGRGKAEAFLYRDGEPVTAGRLPDFDEAVVAAFPPRTILLASAFAAQGGGGGFVGMSTVERRDLFAALLGLGALQERADRARTHRKTLDAADGELGRRRERIAADLGRHRELVERVGFLQAQEPAFVASLDQAIEAHTLAEREESAIVALRSGAVSARERALARRTAIGERSTEIARLADEARAALRDLQPHLDAGDAIEADHKRRAVLLEQRAEAVATWRAAKAHLDAAAATRREHLSQVERLAAKSPTDPGVDLDAAEAALAAASERVQPLFDAYLAIRGREREHRHPSAVRGDLERARADAGLVNDVPCEGRNMLFADDPAGRANCGECPLLTGAQAARARVAPLEQEFAAADRHGAELAAALADVDAARARRDSAAAVVERCRAWAAYSERVALHAAAVALEAERQAELEAAHRAGEAIGKDLAALDGADARWDRLLAARTSHPLLAQRLLDLGGEDSRLRAELDGLVVPELDDAQERALTAAERRRKDCWLARQVAQGALNEHRGHLSSARGSLDELGDVPAQLAALDAAAHDVGLRRSGFVLLEQALGRDGIQALEIDAAGPEVSELATELLSACYGGRFTCELSTLREAEGNRKQREAFDLLVHDGQRGGCRMFEELSGGEQVVVDEALKLAIAVFNARRHGRIHTLWRDEADGRLDPERAAAFPDMLRRALELGGFHRLFYVSHNPVVQAQADARIVVDGGTAVVEV